ncbi:hypothetical protein POJ06DRAFT_36334 [Lipomyces tetrasporus]|uniref:Uncharacterized protein n=1 Tax=Lipomyces tetrasporus TaxID=54092 RepID=A0AAD7VQJ1_9ASCO|nr:uncharacterized protein POJ06DRAFT_36334 [Lipomyces tetrasporus]KAJ8097644.1 hypothetical protein POJ06DRAFT_36334 [Lipomyces tetrasporus]
MSPTKRAKQAESITPEQHASTKSRHKSPAANELPSPTVSESVLTEPSIKDEASQASIESMDPAILDEEEVPASPPTKHHFAGGYDEIKTFKGQYYAGMAIGGSHTWNYDQGLWNETKIEPDLWKIDYQTTKRRARNAPQGSGAPVGTEYHWLIVGHQHVRKEDANTYSTHLTGSKYKLAHKSATSEKWSIGTVMGQRQREIELLEDAKRRVEGLPPVLKEQKVQDVKQQKGQRTLDSLFRANVGKDGKKESEKRKREYEEGEGE